MSKIIKIVGVLVVVLALFAFVGSSKKEYTGGSFNPVKIDFAQVISVNGTDVISNTGALITSALTSSGTSLSAGSTTVGLNYYKPIVTPTADTTLTAAQSGTVFNIGTAGVDLTLPAVASSNGVHYRFVIWAAYATTNITVVSAEGDNIEGTLRVAVSVVDCDANDVITSVADGENIGDYWDLYSNGTYWYLGSSGALTASKLTCSG